MGNFLHKLFGYADDESSCFANGKNRPASPNTTATIPSNKVQPVDVERGQSLTPQMLHPNGTSTPSYRSARTNFNEYSDDEEDFRTKTLFPKVSQKRPKSSPPGDHNNNSQANVNSNNNRVNRNQSAACRLENNAPRGEAPPCNNNNTTPTANAHDDGTGSFHSIALNSVHSIEDRAVPLQAPTSPPHNYDGSTTVVTFQDPQSLPNLNLSAPFVSPFKRDFAVQEHSVLKVAERDRPRRSNVRRSTRIKLKRTASDSRQQTSPSLSPPPSSPSPECNDIEEENLEDLPADERRRIASSKLEQVIQRQSHYRSVYEFTDPFGRYQLADSRKPTITSASTTTSEQDSTSQHSKLQEPDDSSYEREEIEIEEITSDTDSVGMEPLAEHDDVPVVTRRPMSIGMHNPMLMEELKKRQSRLVTQSEE